MESGIYQILNTHTGDFYIGSSKNLVRRRKEHFSDLKKNKSHSKILQNAWNKYGEIHFVFKILAHCPQEYLFKLEQWFVDTLKPKYNICIIDVSTPVETRRQKYYDETQYRVLALERLETNSDFGWKSRIIEELNDNNEIVRTYKSLKEFATINNCAIGNVGTCLKRNHKCKGKKIRYQVL